MATMQQANRALKQLPELARDQVQRVMDVTAFQVARRAAALARRRTGQMAGAITWKSRPRSVSAVVGISDPAVFYWKYHEYGTVTLAAQPMFRPAAEGLRADHDTRLIKALQEADRQLERLAGG